MPLARAVCFGALLAAGLFHAQRATATTTRLALVVGHNEGRASDVPLQFAEKDAQRVSDLLRELGGFGDVRLRRRPSAAQLQGELASVRASIRAAKQRKERTFLLFYFSGHADGRALLLGGSEIEGRALLAELAAAGADLCLVILDACGTGTWTRNKGLKVETAAPLPRAVELEAEGQVILASASANEAAQESEHIRGSFFTSYLVSGLRGAADADGNGEVSLREVYSFAYDQTVRSTVTSGSGLQHPSYRVQLSGARDMALSWPGRSEARLGFTARTPGTFLVLTADESALVAEVPAQPGKVHTIGLRRGSYVVKKRGPSAALVGRVVLASGSDAVLDENDMQKVPYVFLAERGGRRRGFANVELGGVIIDLASGLDWLLDFTASYYFDLGLLALWPGLGLSTGTDEDFDDLDQTVVGLRPELGLVKPFGFPRWSALVGVVGSVPIYFQQIENQTMRVSTSFGFQALLGSGWWIGDRVGLVVRGTLGLGWLDLEPDPEAGVSGGWTARFVCGVRAGVRFR